MTFFKNTQTRKVLSFYLICALLTVSFTPFTKAASDYSQDSRDDMQAHGSASASVSYANGLIQSSHTTTAWIWEEGGSLNCSSFYNLSATQVRGQFEPPIINPVDDAGQGTAKNDAPGNANTHTYYHSSSLSAAADLDARNMYRLTAYTRLEASNPNGTLQVQATAVEEWGSW